jgi:hypothetical protein
MKIIRRLDADYIDGGAIRQIEEARELCHMLGAFGAEVIRVDEEICFNTKNATGDGGIFV